MEYLLRRLTHSLSATAHVLTRFGTTYRGCDWVVTDEEWKRKVHNLDPSSNNLVHCSQLGLNSSIWEHGVEAWERIAYPSEYSPSPYRVPRVAGGRRLVCWAGTKPTICVFSQFAYLGFPSFESTYLGRNWFLSCGFPRWLQDVQALFSNAHLFRIKSWLRQMTVTAERRRGRHWQDTRGSTTGNIMPLLLPRGQAEEHDKTGTWMTKGCVSGLWEQRKQITWNIYYILWIFLIYDNTNNSSQLTCALPNTETHPSIQPPSTEKNSLAQQRKKGQEVNDERHNSMRSWRFPSEVYN